MSTEIWLPVPGYEYKFIVSDHGTLYNILTRKIVKGAKLPIGGHIYLKLESHRVPGTKGKNRTSISAYIHQLVLLAFVGEPPTRMESRHLNGVPDDNRLFNLIYGTRRRNLQDRKWHNGTSLYKLSPEDVKAIKFKFSVGYRAEDISIEYDIHIRTVYDILQCMYHNDV